MRWTVILVVVLFGAVLFFSNVVNTNALSTSMNSTYQAGETAIVQIYGPVLSEISTTQIEFKRNNVRVPFDFDIQKINGNYYLWAIMPQSTNNYTLYIHGVSTTINGVNQVVDLVQNFSVSLPTIDYNVKPGFITASTDFNIDAILNGDIEQSIDISFPTQRQVTLTPGDNLIKFSVAGLSAGAKFVIIQIGKYNIPAYITIQNVSQNTTFNNQTNQTYTNNSNVTSNNNTIINQTNQTYTNNSNVAVNNSTVNNTINSSIINQTVFNSTENFTANGTIEVKFSPKIIESTILINELNVSYPFSIINTGERNLTDLQLIYNKSLFRINSEDSLNLTIQNARSYNITLVRPIRGEMYSVIYVKYGSYTNGMIVYINTTTDENATNTPYLQANSTDLAFCVELKGQVCDPGMTCSTSEILSRNGKCCTSTCVAQSKGISKTIGWILVGIVLLVIIILFVHYRKTKADQNPIQTQVAQVEKKEAERRVK